MDVAIVTVGDELLAGETENTNATWLARQVTARGARVTRVLTVPDERAVIAEAVGDYHAAFDAVVLTGGLGDTHDDVTMAGVADALGRNLVVDADARADVTETIDHFHAENPELREEFPGLSIDVDAQASIPEGGRTLPNPVGLAPGCVVDGVYVLPGIPQEMKATFEAHVAERIDGDGVTVTLYTPVPEGAITETLERFRSRFDVAVGSYPSNDDFNRIRVRGTDADAVQTAAEWLRSEVQVADPEAFDDGAESSRDDPADGPSEDDPDDDRVETQTADTAATDAADTGTDADDLDPDAMHAERPDLDDIDADDADDPDLDPDVESLTEDVDDDA